MSRGRLATDSLAFVNQTIDGHDLAAVAAGHLHQAPAFWGRYFKRPAYPRDYSPVRESAILRRDGIPVLPVARQTTRVAGTVEDGLADGDRNVDAFIEAFGVDHLAAAGSELLMFLDVEAGGQYHPSLSLAYFIGWSNALMQRSAQLSNERFHVVPGVYARQRDNITWSVLAHAADLGHPVTGAWISRSRRGACQSIPEWDPEFFMPARGLPCPVMAWQFALDCFHRTLDFSMVNPSAEVEHALLSRLVIP